ncbi:oligomeric Golgi complex subunit 6 [Dipodascopsis tothii]|uniref:oligomeric Golgi complex subunit 6 n=1 Tax=Dipodascopsis tothii TaxID=44089 RepID=UPI0034CFE79F
MEKVRLDEADEAGAAKAPTSLAVSSAGKSNLLSIKLSEILATTYADGSIKEALVLLGDRVQNNTPEMRRQFRANVEAEVIEANGQVLEQFSKMARQLDDIWQTLATITTVVEDMGGQIERSKADTRELFVSEAALAAQRDDVLVEQQLLDAFKAHFVLSEREVDALTLSGEPVDGEFFALVRRAKQIHEDCQVLLTDEDQSLGLEIMESVSRSLDAAYDKLFHWTTREIRALSLDDPQIRVSLRRALGLLAERPSLFQVCLDALSELRQKVILREFLSALTDGAKPIELYAYDSFRYVGDMLAWAHAAAAGEREALELLFDADAGDIAAGLAEAVASEPWQDTLDVRRTVNTLVDRNLHLVCKPLKVRIDQTLAGSARSTVAYQIMSLLQFYKTVFRKVLDDDAELLAVLQTLAQSALNQFHRNLREQLYAMQTSLPDVPADLQPPFFLHDALAEMRTLMASYDTSITGQADDRDDEFAAIVEEALDPYLTCCLTMADAGRLDPTAKAIYMTNCFDAVQTTLRLFAFTRLKQDEYAGHMDAHFGTLVAALHAKFLADSHLQRPLEALRAKPAEVDLASVPEFASEKITQLSIALDDFLPSALMDAQTFLGRLSIPRLVTRVIQDASARFVKDFADVEAAIVASIEFPRTLFPRTVAEVKVLLVID